MTTVRQLTWEEDLDQAAAERQARSGPGEGEPVATTTSETYTAAECIDLWITGIAASVV